MKMKPIHLRKLAAIMEVKGKALFSKNFIIMPIFSLGFTFLMKLVYRAVTEGAFDLSAYALSLGVLMNILMEGVYCTAAALAEEKEKYAPHTDDIFCQRAGIFLGSLIPVVLMSSVVNVLCTFIAGFDMEPSQWISFLAITVACSSISAVIGMIFGIFAKTQVSASTITTPALLIFMMIPMFSGFGETLEKVSGLLFTGIIFNAIANIDNGLPVTDMKGIIVLAAEFLVSVIIFLALYRKNGFER